MWQLAVELGLRCTFHVLLCVIMGDMANPLPYAVNPLPFAGKVIAVTGASRGLGLALSKYLLIRGATVSNAPVGTAYEIFTDFTHTHAYVGLYVCNFS